jgi:hypothetical protein
MMPQQEPIEDPWIVELGIQGSFLRELGGGRYEFTSNGFDCTRYPTHEAAMAAVERVNGPLEIKFTGGVYQPEWLRGKGMRGGRF